MEATIISNIEDLSKVKTKAVVLSFRPNFVDILKISKQGIKVIQVNQATDNSLSKNARHYLEQLGIKLQVGNIQGIKKEVIEIPMESY